MAEVVGSAVVGEAVSRILSSLLSGDGDDAADCSSQIKLERLEMAVLKLETVVAVSEDWQITHPPLLHWKAKLELVAEEGRHVLRARGGRNTSQQQQQGMRRISSSSFRLRVARAARRFAPLIRGAAGGGGGGDGGELSEAMVRRFERLANGDADSFLQLVERASSRRPKPKEMVNHFVPALSRSSLAAGEAMELSVRMGCGTAIILLQPWWLIGGGVGEAGRKTAACLWVSYEHDTAWEKNLKLMAAFHLPDQSTMDIMRIAMDFVGLLPSQQFSTARAAMKELVAEMSFHGKTSPAPSAAYTSFVRFIQNAHRYGFEPAANHGSTSRNDDGGCSSPLPEQVLMICAHCYVLPPGRGAAPVELVWHRSPYYLPKKLSEQHEPLVEPQQIRPELLAGVTTDGSYQQHGRQWWCPRSSTRLSMAPIISPPKGVLQWYREKARSSAGVTQTATQVIELAVGA